MARAARDENSTTALLGTSNANGQTPLPVYVDAVTNRLLVQATISGSISANTEYTEGDTDTTITGIASMAEGPSNTLTPLQVDASKHLQVDIAADSVGIGGGIQYTEGDTDASITGNALMFEGAANALVAATGDATNGLDVDVTRSALPSGASTSAKQDTIIGHLDGVEGLLTTIDGDTSNISTKIDTLAGAVSGTEFQVDVLTLPAIPVGNNNIGDVDVASLPGDVEADIDQIRDQIDLITPDIEEIRVDADAIRVATELIDDAVFVDDADWTDNTSKHINIGGVYQSSPHTVTDGDVSPALMDANGRFIVAATDNGGSLTVDGTVAVSSVGGTVAVTQSGIWDEVGINDSGNSITVDQATGSNLHTVVDSGTITTVSAVTAISNALPTGTNAIGRVGHDITGIGHGVTTVTTAGTDVALAGSTACKRVTIQAQTDNTSLIAVGGTGVDATIATGTGIILYPGDSFELEIDNLADVFIDSLVNGEGVRYCFFT